MAKADAFGLYVIRHRDWLPLDEWEASHEVVGDSPTDTVQETLVRATTDGIEHIRASFDNIISIESARPGYFDDDTEGGVMVHADGSYEAVDRAPEDE